MLITLPTGREQRSCAHPRIVSVSGSAISNPGRQDSSYASSTEFTEVTVLAAVGLHVVAVIAAYGCLLRQNECT